MSSRPFIFPAWTNSLRVAVAVVGGVVPMYIALLVAYGAVPETTDVGYQPTQPVPFSHSMHAGDLGMDCRYCHSTVEVAAHAAVPPTQTCMNCHSVVQRDSDKLVRVLESAATGNPIPWVRVHDLPDYSYFDHSAHVNRGVGCVECHGRVDRMEVVYQAKPLSMGWCLECHRNPEPNLRPRSHITRRDLPAAQAATDAGVSQADLARDYQIRSAQYLTSCSVCHR